MLEHYLKTDDGHFHIPQTGTSKFVIQNHPTSRHQHLHVTKHRK